MRGLFFVALATLLLTTGCTQKPSEPCIAKKVEDTNHFHPAEISHEGMTKHHRVYLPIYSHVYTSKDVYEETGVTLSIRNSDPDHTLMVEKITYYNTQGEAVKQFLDQPHLLNAMGTIDFVLPLKYGRGESGASFIVAWAGEPEISAPVIQAVMVNVSGPMAFAFATDGVTVR